jgi:hypothetical protein
MMSDGRTQGLLAAGFPVGCPSPGARGQVGSLPAPATSNRACGSPAHGLPTPFTAGIRFLPPGLVGPGCDHGSVRAPRDVSAQDLVPQRMKPSSGISLGRPVQRVLQGTHLIQRNPVEDNGSAVGGTSLNGTHRAPPTTSTRIDEAVALPSPAVVLSARLNRYYGHLRRPPGWLPLPGSSPVIGHRAPTALRSRLGRGGPLQFPPPLSERSEPLTPGSPSRLHLQDLHRFHGLHPVLPGSALPRPTRHRAGDLTTRQASHHVTDRSVARPVDRGARRWASTSARFQTTPPACYRAS